MLERFGILRSGTSAGFNERSKARVELQGLIASMLRCFRAVGFYKLKFKVPSCKFKVRRRLLLTLNSQLGTLNSVFKPRQRPTPARSESVRADSTSLTNSER